MYEEEIQLKINKLVDSLENEYNYYTLCGNNALEKGNISASQLHFIEASAFARAKWIVEYIMYEE